MRGHFAWICFLLIKTLQAVDYDVLLVQYLTNNITDYSPLVLPRLNSSKAIDVSIDILISHIVSIDTAKQSVKISAYLEVSWEDERLVWDYKNFGGVRFTLRDTSQIWHPNLLVYNGNGNDQVIVPQTSVGLLSKTPSLTRVFATWRREFEYFCRLDMNKFPFDQHSCDLIILLGEQGFYANVFPAISQEQKNELAIYQETNEWELKNATALIRDLHYAMIKGRRDVSTLRSFVLQLSLKRISTYYVINIITPLLLLSLLQVLVYIVPLESGEKLSFGITIMLSYTVFLLLLDGILPKSQKLPALALFITAAMSLSAVSLLLTSLSMWFHFMPDGTRMSALCRAVFVRTLGRLMRVSGCGAVQVQQSQAPTVSSASLNEATGKVRVPVSDWAVAARAIERLITVFGVIATAVIIGVFIVRPYS